MLVTDRKRVPPDLNFKGSGRAACRSLNAGQQVARQGDVKPEKGSKPEIGILAVRMVRRPAQVCVGVVHGPSDGART